MPRAIRRGNINVVLTARGVLGEPAHSGAGARPVSVGRHGPAHDYARRQGERSRRCGRSRLLCQLRGATRRPGGGHSDRRFGGRWCRIHLRAGQSRCRSGAAAVVGRGGGGAPDRWGLRLRVVAVAAVKVASAAMVAPVATGTASPDLRLPGDRPACPRPRGLAVLLPALGWVNGADYGYRGGNGGAWGSSGGAPAGTPTGDSNFDGPQTGGAARQEHQRLFARDGPGSGNADRPDGGLSEPHTATWEGRMMGAGEIISSGEALSKLGVMGLLCVVVIVLGAGRRRSMARSQGLEQVLDGQVRLHARGAVHRRHTAARIYSTSWARRSMARHRPRATFGRNSPTCVPTSRGAGHEHSLFPRGTC